VSVVVVSWNGARLLPACLDALLAQDAPGRQVEIVVVDNGSTDQTLPLLRESYPTVRVVALPSNAGFAVGANRGIAASTAPLVVLVNNDAVCAPGFVAALLAPFEGPDADQLGAVTARIVLADRYRLEPADAPSARRFLRGYDGSRWAPTDASDPRGLELLNSTGNEVTRSGNGRDRDWLRPVDAAASASDVFGFCGGAAALRRSALDAVGGFDEDLFLYYEDSDLSWRLRRQGWRVEYAHAATVFHQHAASSDAHSEFFGRHNDRNRIVVALRNAPAPVAMRAVTHMCGRAARDVLRGRHVGRHLTTARYVIAHGPRLWRERRDLKRRATVSHDRLAHYLVPDGPPR
jgi:N-acetylglucosaminyl-diphospho-decaprenol L-rhamnosyltransferase